ncbi:MAG: hypothetical protein AB1505_25035 [Candidatus Latescibacterota bacterium]
MNQAWIDALVLTLRTFVLSPVGQVLPEQATGAGWLALACTALAGLLAWVEPATASSCGSGGKWGSAMTCGVNEYYCQLECEGFGYQCHCCLLDPDIQRCYCFTPGGGC